MRFEICDKESFSVIGKLGSTADGENFVQKLWAEANSHFEEIKPLLKTDEKGNPVGFWGAMSDMSLSFMPWENDFSKGLYLAGGEVNDNCEAPDGWTKWTVPSFRFLYTDVKPGESFGDIYSEFLSEGYSLKGAAQDFTNPKDGKNYIFLPIEKL